MPEFLKVITSEELIRRLAGFPRLPAEKVALDESLHRYTAENMISGEDLPVWGRSTVDGYAVRAEDTFGASDSIPALLENVARIEMGTVPDVTIRPGETAQIPTGGFLPRGADAVVMVEYTNQAGKSAVEISRPLTAGTNVIQKGEDMRLGAPVLPAGSLLRPQEMGLLAALGIPAVPVRRRPRVAVISTGDELIPVERTPAPGQIRDANAHAVRALVRAAGADPLAFDIVPDNAAKLREVLGHSLSQSDVVALSGGSSIGIRDLMLEVVSGLPGIEILAHGIAIRPGKPTLLADQKGKAIFGLPGHPASALVVAQVFLVPFLKYLQGATLQKGPLGQRMKAMLATSIHSTIGLEEFVRVSIRESAQGGYAAHPQFGKSGLLSTMVKADGIVVIPMRAEGLAAEEIVDVCLF